MKTKISRRDLIKKTLSGIGALSVPISMTACNGNDSSINDKIKVEFNHGVASGDPLRDSIILWTRATPSDLSVQLQVDWEISEEKSFSKIVNQGRVLTKASDDFTIKVDAQRLLPGRTYFYRFKYGSVVSPIGKTKTLPSETNLVKFAVCSCSNYPAGYFNVYKEMAQQELDAVLHLGDYIYEYGMGSYGTDEAKKLGRTLDSDNDKEILNLTDYRKRYSIYRRDENLQSLHQAHPFIVVWDDHELANDAWLEGAENHTPETEGDFVTRKAAALQAYFEWMPIRPITEHDHLNIYRQFNFGDYLNLNMLDTRILARSKQLSYSNYLTPQGLDEQKFKRDLYDSNRTLLGDTQFEWLKQKLSASTAKWNVLGQQVLMAKMLIPAEVLFSLEKVRSGKADSNTLLQINTAIAELLTIKARAQKGDPTLTPVELARINTVAPYNLDAWDGYAAARESLYAMLKSVNKKVVVLAGDTHNGWNSELRDNQGNFIGVELATSSISSPGMEKYLNISDDQLAQFEMAFSALIDELSYCNLKQRGYLRLTFNQDQLISEWIYVDTIKSKDYKILSNRNYVVQYNSELIKQN